MAFIALAYLGVVELLLSEELLLLFGVVLLLLPPGVSAPPVAVPGVIP
jgi:hypothetical protein